MSFPTTSVLDDFNRANGSLGSNWTTPLFAQSNPSISSNAVIAPASVYGSGYWNVTDFGPDCETFLTIPSGATSIDTVHVHAKLRNIGTGTECGYLVVWKSAASASIVRRYDQASSSALATDTTTIAAGDKVGICVKSSGNDFIIEAWRAPVSTGIWGLVFSYTDVDAVNQKPNLVGNGYSGFAVYGNNANTRSIDDFGAGTVTTLTLDNCLPDADVTTTGWSTAPLYSKINDASDATVITATAS